MIRRLARCIREYKWAALLSPLCMVGEVAMEVLIPLVMADLYDYGIKMQDMQVVAASLMGPEDVVIFVSYSGSTRDMMDTLHLAKENGAKVILITHYDDAPGTALADVVLLCGAKENPLDSGSMPVKLAVLFVANVLVLRYTLDNQELTAQSLSRTSHALGSKLM